MRTRYLLKAGFKHYRRKPSLSQGRFGLALNWEQQERLRSIFPILPRRKGKARSRKACAGTRKYIRRRDETEMLVCHQRHQKIGDKKDGDLSTQPLRIGMESGARVEDPATARPALRPNERCRAGSGCACDFMEPVSRKQVPVTNPFGRAAGVQSEAACARHSN
jgi:hypothetical protein